jgi:LemA protein
MDSSTISGIVFFLFGAAVFVYGIVLYKGLARLRKQDDRAWADIDALLKQRYDEIPNLLESVKGCMRHEQSTLLAVTEACTSSMSAATIREKALADLEVASALYGLFVAAENYPQLKANENFLTLRSRMAELEERIDECRKSFNEDVAAYNTRVGQIPDVFVASIMDIKPREMFKVPEKDRRPVQPNLAGSQATGAKSGDA